MKTALGILGVLVLATAAIGAPITGNLSIANLSGGGVVVSALGIDWYNPTNPSFNGVGDFSTGGPTNINYSGGTITSATNPYGRMRDVPIGAGVILNFIQFYTSLSQPSPSGTGTVLTFPSFDLTVVYPGVASLPDCAGVTAVDVSCTPHVVFGALNYISPFVLTRRSTGLTDVSLSVGLLAHDALGSWDWVGTYTTQVAQTPSGVQSTINAGGNVNSTYSGTFVASPIPEPASMLFMGSGLLLFGFISKRIRRK